MGLKAEDALAASIAYTDGVVTGDLKITETSDGGLQFSANGGSSVVVLGPDRVRGRGIKSTAINDSQHLIITYSDDEVEDLGLIKVKSDRISINENSEFKMNLKITKYDDNGNESEEITDNLKPAVIKVEEDGSNDDVNYRINFTTYDENGNPSKTLTSPNMMPPKHNINPNENNNDYSFKVNISTKDENGTKLEITPNLKGNIFWEGVDIIGESMIFEVKAEDGINYSRKNDLYLNSVSGNIYKRTDTDNVNNFWTKIGCLKGPIGKGAYQEAVEEGFSGTRAEWLLTLVGQSNLTEKRWQKPLISDEGTDMQVWYYYQIDGNEPNTAWKYILTPPDGLYRAGNYAFNVNTKYYTFTSVQDLEIGGAGIYDIKYIADERNGKLTAYLTNKETSEEIEYTLDITIQSSVPEGFIEVPVSATLLGKWVQTMYLGSSKTNCEEITITTGMSLDGIITSDVFFGIIGDSVLKIGINVKDAINKIFDMIKSDPDAVLNTNANSLFEAVNELVDQKYMDCYELVDSNLLDHALNSEYKTLSSNFIYCENCTNTPSGNNGYGYVMMIISQDTHYRQLIFFDPSNGKISTNNIGANETNDGFGLWSGWNYGLGYSDVTQKVNSNSTDKEIPSAKAVFDSIPIGTIQAYYGRAYDLTIPDGWMLCDGSIINDEKSPLNGKTLPDMRNKVLAMANSVSDIGSTTGSNIFKLNKNQLPNVSIETTGTLSYTPKGTITINSNGSHTHSYGRISDTHSKVKIDADKDWGHTGSWGTGNTGSAGSHSHSATFKGASQTLSITTSGSLNGGVTQQSINNMQATMYVEYIMKIK